MSSIVVAVCVILLLVLIYYISSRYNRKGVYALIYNFEKRVDGSAKVIKLSSDPYNFDIVFKAEVFEKAFKEYYDENPKSSPVIMFFVDFGKKETINGIHMPPFTKEYKEAEILRPSMFDLDTFYNVNSMKFLPTDNDTAFAKSNTLYGFNNIVDPYHSPLMFKSPNVVERLVITSALLGMPNVSETLKISNGVISGDTTLLQGIRILKQ